MNPISSRLILVALSLALVAPPATAGDCLKMVFGKHCLGGEAEKDPETADDVTVRVHDGRTAWVERMYKPGNMLMYMTVIVQLEQKYGAGLDFDYFGGYHGREGLAVSRAQGFGLRKWPMGQWEIRLTWVSPEGILLRYSDVVLEAAALKDDSDL